MFNFDFFEKGLEILSPPHFLIDFQGKSFCLILLTDLTAYTKKYLQSDWLRRIQYWPYLYSVFNICTL